MQTIVKFRKELLNTHDLLLVSNENPSETLPVDQATPTSRTSGSGHNLLLIVSGNPYWANDTGHIIDAQNYPVNFTLMAQPKTITKFANIYNRCATLFDTDTQARQAAQPDCLAVAYPVTIPDPGCVQRACAVA